MRKYRIEICMPSSYVEEGQTAENDLKALKNGDLPLYDLLELAENDPEATLNFSVVDYN